MDNDSNSDTVSMEGSEPLNDQFFDDPHSVLNEIEDPKSLISCASLISKIRPKEFAL